MAVKAIWRYSGGEMPTLANLSQDVVSILLRANVVAGAAGNAAGNAVETAVVPAGDSAAVDKNIVSVAAAAGGLCLHACHNNRCRLGLRLHVPRLALPDPLET